MKHKLTVLIKKVMKKVILISGAKKFSGTSGKFRPKGENLAEASADLRPWGGAPNRSSASLRPWGGASNRSSADFRPLGRRATKATNAMCAYGIYCCNLCFKHYIIFSIN
jgi:hypothetical protein